MKPHWPIANQQPGVTGARRIRPPLANMPKVVFSATLSAVEGNARLVSGDASARSRGSRPRTAAEGVAGATLAKAKQAGLIDEYMLVTHLV